MNRKTEKNRTFTLIFTAIMSALILIMTFTGFGYIPIGPLKLTLNTLPVAVGAMVCGAWSGLFLGAVFGLSSFATALFGMDALGVVLLSLGWKQAIFLLITCLVPRLLCGWIPGILQTKIWQKHPRYDILNTSLGCALTVIINTVLFLSFFWIFFAKDLMYSKPVLDLFGGAVDSFWLLFTIFAGWNALIEVGVNLILGTAIVKAIRKQRV